MFLTIFTPAYNRRKRLPALYASLQRQTNKNFEWIIIDDGSKDDTWDYLNQIQQQPKDFAMYSFKQANGGKHRAINRAVKIAKGKYFFIVDSDDYLTDDAVEKISAWCQDLERDPMTEKNKVCGVVGLRGGEGYNNYIGGAGDGRKVIDASNFERSKLNLGGDKAEVLKTSVMRKFPFPEFPGENFLSEGVVWNRIAAAGYKLRYHMDIIYICEYLPGGLTDSLKKNQLKCFQGYTLQTREEIHFPTRWKAKMASISKWTDIAHAKGLNNRQCVNELQIPVWYFYISNFIFKVYMKIRYGK